jgi:acetyl esterase/lipase
VAKPLIEWNRLLKIGKWLYYLRLYRVNRLARRYATHHEHGARDIRFSPHTDACLDVYSPAAGDNHPVLLYVHGGGYRHYTKELFAVLAMKIVPQGVVVVIPDNTPYPAARYEQMTREIAAAISWTLENIAQYGGNPRRVVALGHSSGGQLVGLAVMDSTFLQPHGHTSSDLRGMIFLSTAADAGAQYEYEEAKGGTELGGTILGVMGGRENFAKASPINYVRAGLPPSLILHGVDDSTVPVSAAEAFHSALKDAGARSKLKVYPGSGHTGLALDAAAHESSQLIADILDFVLACTSSSAPSQR